MTKGRPSKRPLDEVLHKLYVDQKMTQAQVAEHLGVSLDTIRRWMKDAHIETRMGKPSHQATLRQADQPAPTKRPPKMRPAVNGKPTRPFERLTPKDQAIVRAQVLELLDHVALQKVVLDLTLRPARVVRKADKIVG